MQRRNLEGFIQASCCQFGSVRAIRHIRYLILMDRYHLDKFLSCCRVNSDASVVAADSKLLPIASIVNRIALLALGHINCCDRPRLRIGKIIYWPKIDNSSLPVDSGYFGAIRAESDVSISWSTVSS